MFSKIIIKVSRIYKILFSIISYKPLFSSFGDKSTIDTPLKIINSKNIEIGENVTIEKFVTLYSIGEYNNKIYNGKIQIGNNVYINNNCNFTSSNKIKIEDNVVIAFNVSCFDFNHEYSDISVPVKNSGLSVLGEVTISENCWIGMNVSIIGNVFLGKNCIVGANSVVTKSFPDNSVIAGAPAKIIKRYDNEKKVWKRVDIQGEFLDEI